MHCYFDLYWNSTVKWKPYNLSNFQKTMKINNTKASVKIKIIFCKKVTCSVCINIQVNFKWCSVMFSQNRDLGDFNGFLMIRIMTDNLAGSV